jgi:hypothetical protein
MHHHSIDLPRARTRRSGARLAWLGVAALLATAGCQAIVPSALGGKLALSEDARIVKQAKADSFPTPADVGLTPVDSEL